MKKQNTNGRILLTLIATSLMVLAIFRVTAQETQPVGPTKADQKRNAELLKGYDHTKYPSSITGYTGQNRQQIVFERRAKAVRTRIGTRGNYKTGLTQLGDGALLAAVCRDNYSKDPRKRRFAISIYQSKDLGLSWKKINQTELFGKEPSLTTMKNGTIVMTSQKGYFGPGSQSKVAINMALSKDNGKTWQRYDLKGADYPRNLVVEPDGSLLLVRALESDWSGKGGGSPHLQLGRSKDGRNWKFSVGRINWNYAAFGEVSTVRLKSGRLLAALRRQIPKTHGEGFEDTAITSSDDGGKTWSKPRVFTNTAEVHVYLTELQDGRVLATYSNYHLPYGAYAIVSGDGGKSWDLDNPIRLAASADLYVGWPVTLQLKDRSLVTAYAITAYLLQPPEKTAAEFVRWRLK